MVVGTYFQTLNFYYSLVFSDRGSQGKPLSSYLRFSVKFSLYPYLLRFSLRQLIFQLQFIILYVYEILNNFLFDIFYFIPLEY